MQQTVYKITDECKSMENKNEDFKNICDETMGRNKDELERLNENMKAKADSREIK